jgi:MMPL family
VAGDDVLVGGPTAEEYDLRQSAARDNRLIVPIALVVVFLILAALLRAITAPLVLIGTVILSYFAALGVSAFFFDVVFDFPGMPPRPAAVRVRLPGGAGHRLQHLPDGAGARGNAHPRHPRRNDQRPGRHRGR